VTIEKYLDFSISYYENLWNLYITSKIRTHPGKFTGINQKIYKVGLTHAQSCYSIILSLAENARFYGEGTQLKNRLTSVNRTEKMAEGKKKSVAELIREIQGDRSQQEYAKAAGVSPPALSRMLKGDYKPSPATIKKLTSREANPQGWIRTEDLMVAAGYSDKSTEDLIEEVLGDKLGLLNEDGETGKETDRNSLLSERGRTWQERNEEEREYRERAVTIIIAEFVKKGIRFRYEDIETPVFRGVMGEVSRHSYEFGIEKWGGEIKKWTFDIRYYDKERANLAFSRSLLGSLLFKKIGRDEKISFVVNNKDVFDSMRRYEGKIAYRGDFSVILINPDEDMYEEVYLSHYMDDDNGNNDFYLFR